MTKSEVMTSLRKDFDNELLPQIRRHWKKYEALIRQKSIREKKMICLDWEFFTSSNGIVYSYRIRGNSTNCIQDYVCEFVWQGRKCYAGFFDNEESVLVFHQHCLERYKERVLMDNDVSLRDIFYRILLKNADESFHIVLPSPKRYACEYVVFADALFLGDYVIPKSAGEPSLIWCNTCISLKEAHRTQTGVINSLGLMQDYIKTIGFNPIKDRALYNKMQSSLISNAYGRKSLTEYFIRFYQLYLLQSTFNFSFYHLFSAEIDSDIAFLKAELSLLGIDTATISPFSDQGGFAIKGEIDYRAKI